VMFSQNLEICTDLQVNRQKKRLALTQFNALGQAFI